MSIPPTQETIFAFDDAKNQLSSFLTCRANSLVGTIISASGELGVLNNLLSVVKLSTIANPKAIVLPEPVCAETSKSKPEYSSLITSSCTGVNFS